MSALEQLQKRNNRNEQLEIENAKLARENKRLTVGNKWLSAENRKKRSRFVSEIINDPILLLHKALDSLEVENYDNVDHFINWAIDTLILSQPEEHRETYKQEIKARADKG